eukprot:TRINITY_DN2298_c0_g3_i1.p1 TRINITY_DN2298_c0_g3~~TRINITY_DN2298_c0_g3_i1.p1  ORF type:complete len:398 (+),score=64.61 TRINITY_DN2298_c0_g3_i1:64-1257(+)
MESIAKDTLDIIFSMLPTTAWFNVKLVSKNWSATAERIFDPSRCDALRKLIKSGNETATLKLLEDKRIDPSAHQNFAITRACLSGQYRVVQRLLLDKRVDPSASGNYSIKQACEKGHLEIVNLLLNDERTDPSADGDYCITYAGWKGHIDIVNRLLEDKRVNPSSGSNRCIKRVCAAGHLDILERLLRIGSVDPSASFNHPIRFAVNNGHYKIVERLLQDYRVDPSVESNYCIKRAVADQNFNIVEILLNDRRVDANAVDTSSIANNTIEIVKILLEKGKLRPTTCSAWLIPVCREKKYDLMRLLIEQKGIDLTIYNNICMHIAYQNNQVDLTEKLLKDNKVNPRKFSSAKEWFLVQPEVKAGKLRKLYRNNFWLDQIEESTESYDDSILSRRLHLI